MRRFDRTSALVVFAASILAYFFTAPIPKDPWRVAAGITLLVIASIAAGFVSRNRLS